MNRLLFILSNRTGKGTYWRAIGFGQELSKMGYDVTCLVVASNKRWGFTERQHHGITIIETPDLMPSSGYDPWDTLKRLFWVRSRTFDLIHAFESRPVVIFPALFLQKKEQLPLILDWCDWFGRGGSVEERNNVAVRTILRPIETFFENNFRTKAQGTTVINSILQKKAVALGVPPETIFTLPNGADTDNIQPQSIDEARQELGLPLNVFILGYTGALFSQDAELMVTAFEKIQQQCPAVRLLLVGYTNIDVAQLAPKIAASIIRIGPVTHSQLQNYVAACNIGWLTLKDIGANQGRFPMKAYDFMVAERPLIVTDVADLGKMVQDKQVGIVALDEPEALANATLKLLADDDMQIKLGKNGRFVAENEFAWPIVTRQLEAFYQKILAEG